MGSGHQQLLSALLLFGLRTFSCCSFKSELRDGGRGLPSVFDPENPIPLGSPPQRLLDHTQAPHSPPFAPIHPPQPKAPHPGLNPLYNPCIVEEEYSPMQFLVGDPRDPFWGGAGRGRGAEDKKRPLVWQLIITIFGFCAIFQAPGPGGFRVRGTAVVVHSILSNGVKTRAKRAFGALVAPPKRGGESCDNTRLQTDISAPLSLPCPGLAMAGLKHRKSQFALNNGQNRFSGFEPQRPNALVLTNYSLRGLGGSCDCKSEF